MPALENSLYFDHAAAAPLADGVAERMHAVLTEIDANPSSTHPAGRAAAAIIDESAAVLAELIGAEPSELVWTSGATEASNLALKGVAEFAGRDAHIVSCVTEHPATRDVLNQLARRGVRVTWLDVDSDGCLDWVALDAALDEQPTLLSLMHVNNETGVVHDIAKVGQRCLAAGVALHVDAAQSAARLPLDVAADGIALMSLSAHKMGGPKGIGALYVRRRPRQGVSAQIHGGGQQGGRRSGTLATHQIAGFGAAAALAGRSLAIQPTLARLRERLWSHIATVGGVSRNGASSMIAAPFLNISVSGVHGGALLSGLTEGSPTLAVSSGAACSAARGQSSYVLRAMGVPARLASASIRFSIGAGQDEAQIDAAAQRFVDEVWRLRRLAGPLEAW
jgi:cysteine desulfurase